MNKKTVWISGGAQGIGLAAAKRYLDLGYYVGIFDLNVEALDKVEKEINSSSLFVHVCDISNEESVNLAMSAFMEKTNGRLDLLLANAGILYFGDYEKGSLSFYKKIIDVNAFGLLVQVNAGLPYLKATKGAAIIVTSSASGISGIPLFAVYGGTKHFTTGLVGALNIELEQHDIFVGDVLPHIVNTPMLGKDSKLASTALSPETVVDAIIDLETKRDRIHQVLGAEEIANAKRKLSDLEFKQFLIDNIYKPFKAAMKK
jgi:short-subunit dehydrogenase